MAGIQDFSDGDPLPAASLDELAKQCVGQYASAAARDADAVLTAALREGLTVFLLDVNCYSVYTGSAWSTLGPVHGSPKDWTPAVVQGGAVTSTNVRSTYTRMGRKIFANFHVSITGTGSAATNFTISLPVTSATSVGTIGFGYLADASAPNQFHGPLRLRSTTTMGIAAATGIGSIDADFGGTSFIAALANTDYIQGWVQYDADVDA